MRPAAAAADQWGEQFKTPFFSQIINTLTGEPPIVQPGPASALLRTVAGLNVGDAVIIDADDSAQYPATITSVDLASHLVQWTWAAPAGVVAQLNGFVHSATSLSAPKQSVLDQTGRIYTADTFNNRVMVFASNGTPLWSIGEYGRVYSDAYLGPDWAMGDCVAPTDFCDDNPAAHLGYFFEPEGIDVSPDGRTIVVADTINNRIQVFVETDGGPIATSAGAAGPHYTAFAFGGWGIQTDPGTPPLGQMSWPFGVALGANGRIAVADQNNLRIQVFDPDAAGAILASNGTRYRAFAFGSFVSASGSATDYPNYPIDYADDVEIDRSGTITDGRIIVADTNAHAVEVFDATGHFVTSFGGAGSDDGKFNLPSMVAVDTDGSIYVADLRNSRIQVFSPTPDGSAYVFVGHFGALQSADPIPGEVLFIAPTGVSIRNGRVAVTEQGGNRVQMLARASLAIESLSATPGEITVQDPGHDTVHVTVHVRNTGGVPLTGVTFDIASSHDGTASNLAPAVIPFLGAAGAALDTATFEFDYKVTNPHDGVDTLHFTLTATGHANNVSVTATASFDSGVVVHAPLGAAVSLANIVLTTPNGSDRMGLHELIVLTATVKNIGGKTLHAISVTATPTNPALVSPAVNWNPTVTIDELEPNASVPVEFRFTTEATGNVAFNLAVTASDPDGATVSSNPPPTMTVHIVSDAVAPVVHMWVTPSADPNSKDGKWYNLQTGPPTLHIEATDPDGGDVARIRWVMLDTSSQPASDQNGECNQSGSDTAPSVCTSAGPGRLLWDRTFFDMQWSVTVAAWAEDAAGNGAVAPGNRVLANCGVLFPCATVFYDRTAPVIDNSTPVLNADNTEARILFTVTDPNAVSLIRSVTSSAGPASLHMQTDTIGELILHGEGEDVFAALTATDNANNHSTFTVPIHLPGRPVLRLDRTPPEAFNRVDPAALGRRCTTTIGGQPVSYFCTNKVYGTDNLPGLTTAAFAPVLVVPVKWGAGGDDDMDHNWDGGNAEYHVYQFTDAISGTPPPVQNPNQVTLIEKVRQSGNEARVRVLAYQYRQGTVVKPMIVADWATKKYEWSLNKDGSLKSLNQKFELHKGRDRVQVQASYDAKSGVTTIKELGPRPEGRVIAQGLILLRMTTASGDLKIDYDVNHPVPLH